MAKVKLGAIVTDISGKLGGHVFSKNRSGKYMRTKGVPTNPQTSAQMLIRGMFAAISSSWSELSELQRTSWRNAVDQFATTDVFGDIKNPTGKALYQRLNQNLSVSDQPLIDSAPFATDVPFLGIISAGGSVATNVLRIKTVGDATANKVLVFATEPLSQGTKFVKNKLRLIEVFAGGDDLALEVEASYTAKFGELVAGANVYFGVKTVNQVGQASPMISKKAVIAA